MTDGRPLIFVVDDDPSVRRAVSRVLRAADFDVVTLDSAEKLLDAFDPAQHGCVVLDVAMPGLSGLDLQDALARRGATLPIVFLSGRGDVPITVRAMKRGAADFLTKPVQGAALIAAVRDAVARDRAARLSRAELDEIERRLGTLTRRELEVLGHVVSGRLNKQAAADLGIAEKTIKVHRARVMEKMRVESVAELVRMTERAGVRPESARAAGDGDAGCGHPVALD